MEEFPQPVIGLSSEATNPPSLPQVDGLPMTLYAFCAGFGVALLLVFLWRGKPRDRVYFGPRDPSEHQSLLGNSRHYTSASTRVRSGGSQEGGDRQSMLDAAKRRISRPIPLSHAMTAPTALAQDQTLWPFADPTAVLAPPPPLPPLTSEEVDSGFASQPDRTRADEARWTEHHRKRALAHSVLGGEPPLGRQLRMSIRAALHQAEVSPEAVAVRSFPDLLAQQGLGGKARPLSGPSYHHALPLSVSSSEYYHTALESLHPRQQTTRNRNVVDIRGISWHPKDVMVGGEEGRVGEMAASSPNMHTLLASTPEAAHETLGNTISSLVNATLFPSREESASGNLPRSSGHLLPQDVQLPESPSESSSNRSSTYSTTGNTRYITHVTFPATPHPSNADLLANPSHPLSQEEGTSPESQSQGAVPEVRPRLSTSSICHARRASTSNLPQVAPTKGGGTNRRQTLYETPSQSPSASIKRWDPAPLLGLSQEHFTDAKIQTWHIPGYGRVRLTDHAPQVYASIRRILGYSLSDLDEALRQPFAQAVRTLGKSDAIFFSTTQDGQHRRFMLKTLRDREPEALRSLLPDYLAHLVRHPDTLLPRFLGVFEFDRLDARKGDEGYVERERDRSRDREGEADPLSDTVPSSQSGTHGWSETGERGGSGKGRAVDGRPVPLPPRDSAFPAKMHLVLMADVFDTNLHLLERYDFKGSRRGRSVFPEEGGPQPSLPLMRDWVMKEQDFHHLVKSGLRPYIAIGSGEKSHLLAILKRDIALLQKHSLMDYSLLIAAASSDPEMMDTPPNTQVPTSTKSTLPSSLGGAGPRSSAAPTRQGTGVGPESPEDGPGLLATASHMLANLLMGRSGMSPADTDLEVGDGALSGGHAMARTPSGRPLPPHDPPRNDSPFSATGEDGQVYIMGLCDVLQKYNLRKRMEKGWKDASGMVLGSSGDGGTGYGVGPSGTSPLMDIDAGIGVSVEEPGKYGERLIKFVDSITL